MKTLIIMRHAKTEVGAPMQKDFDRELIERGINDSNKMAAWIKKKYDAVDAMLVSPAKRTKQTAAIVKEICGGDMDLVDSLYHGDANEILYQIQKTKKKTKVLLMVGHNPAVSGLVSFLSNKFIDLKPSDLVVFELKNKEWDDKLEILSSKHHSVYGL